MTPHLKKNLQTVSNDIKKLSQRIDILIAAMEEPAKSKPVKAKAAKRPVVKLKKKTPVKKETKASANSVVLDIIENSDRAVDIATLKEKTGFQGQKLYNALYGLKKQGKVRNPNKGFYILRRP